MFFFVLSCVISFAMPFAMSFVRCKSNSGDLDCTPMSFTVGIFIKREPSHESSSIGIYTESLRIERG